MNQEATKTYITLLPVDHDGGKYQVGKPIKLTDAQAEALTGINAVALPSQLQRSAASQVDLAAELRAAQARLVDQADAMAAAREAFDELKADLAERDQALESATQELTSLRSDAQTAGAREKTLQDKVTAAEQALVVAEGELAAAKASKATAVKK